MPFLCVRALTAGRAADWLQSGLLTCPEGHQATRARAICVTPFWFSRSDIRPSCYLPLWWALYPPKRSDFEWVFELGYADGLDWAQARAEAAPASSPSRAAASDAGSERRQPRVHDKARESQRWEGRAARGLGPIASRAPASASSRLSAPAAPAPSVCACVFVVYSR